MPLVPATTAAGALVTARAAGGTATGNPPAVMGATIPQAPAGTPQALAASPAGTPQAPAAATAGDRKAPGSTVAAARRAAFGCANPASLYQKPAGSPVSVTVAFAGVTATFTALPAEQPGAGPNAFRHPGLTIRPAGGRTRHVAVQPPWGFSDVPGAVDLTSLSGGANGSPLCVARFGGQHPETAVLVGTYSGGAHCCTWVEAVIAAPRSAAGARPVWQDIGNPGVQLKSYSGMTLLVTADNSFAYTFDSYAGSGMPLRILELRANKFVDTTKSFPSLVRPDASFWWAQYQQVSGPKGQEPGGGLGLLAPWVADECLLGESAKAWATVATLEREGRLKGTPGWPRGPAYVRALRSFLVKSGYCRA